jgi:hypothetical protein
MSYFSEPEENDIYEGDEGDEGDDLSSVESIDEETKNIFYRANYNNTYELEEDKPIKNIKLSQPSTKQNKSALSLQDFVKKIEFETPKKFISKRVSDKKPVTIKKRSFNPRLPPYNLVNQKNLNLQININNINDFPTL